MYTNRRSDPLKKQREQPSEVRIYCCGITLQFWLSGKLRWENENSLGTTVTDPMVEKEILKLHKSYLHVSNKNLSGTRKSFPSDQMSWHLHVT